MKTRLLFFAFILCKFSNLSNGVSAAGNVVYKPGYYEIPGTKGVYKYHDSLKKWDEAVATCASEGASLFYADNYQEFDTVIRFWKTVRNDFPKSFFYGAFRFDGVFKTITGIPITSVYHGWLPGEPNNGEGSEHCVEVGIQNVTVFGLNDVKCDAASRFMCKASMADVECSSTTDGGPTAGSIAKKGYYAIPSMNGLYKYHDTFSVWDNAAATCAAEGASLYYAENDHEFHTLITYWKNMRNDFPREFFVGIMKSNGEFKTISGIPISKVYHGWLPGEPNNLGGNENCVEARNQTLEWGLNDKPCNTLRGFICKWPLANMICVSSTSYDESTEGNIGTSSGYHDIPTTNGVYKYYDTPSMWDESAATCAADGAKLYYADNEDEFFTVLNYWRNVIDNFPREFYYGARKYDGVFKTISGIPIFNVYHGWLAGEPNNSGGNEDCVEARNESGPWGLNDKTCLTTRPFICKYPKVEMECSGTASIGYKYFEPLGKCYKVHRDPKTWTDARAACQAEGSELAVINSLEEAAHIVRLTNKVNIVPGNYTRGVILLGFHKQNYEDWYTVHGQHMSNSGYACWGNNQPNGGDGKDCGAMFHNGRLNDIECNRKALFVCEHTVDDPNIVTEPSAKTVSKLDCNMVYRSLFSYYPFFK